MSVQCLHEGNGKKGQAYAIKDSEYCFFHNPGSAKKRAEAKILIEQWRKEYNQIRPHSALNYRPPAPEAIIPVIMSMGLT